MDATYIEHVIHLVPLQLSRTHGANHQVVDLLVVLVADGDAVRVAMLRFVVEIDVQMFADFALHFHHPTAPEGLHRIRRTVAHGTNLVHLVHTVMRWLTNCTRLLLLLLLTSDAR